MDRLFKRPHPLKTFGALPLMVAVGVMVALLVLGMRVAFRHAYATEYQRAETALQLTINALEADLARYEVVPQLISDLDLIRSLLADPDDHALRHATNIWLQARNDAIRSSDSYVMLPDGETIAASNFEKGPGSFVGRNFSYRPYFIEAMQGKEGRFYGIGVTSGVRGYYFSAPVRDGNGQIAGVVAVKVDVDRIEGSWQDSEYRFLVTDPEGRVFLSSEPGWLYRSLGTPEQTLLDRTRATRRYADADLPDLPLERHMEHGFPVFRIASEAGVFDDFLTATEQMSMAGWTVHVLLDTSGPRNEARLILLSGAMILCAGSFGAMVLLQRRRRTAERLAMQRHATTELERRVDLRTADLARVNMQLQQEILERRQTEADLRAAQTSLVQVGKLAALGQMSASLSHEINQPLAAARNYADSAAILIDRGDPARARGNVTQILALLDRIAAICRHLRDAARKPADQLAAVSLEGLLPETRIIVDPRLANCGAALSLDIPADLPPLNAGPTRLQQVLVNLISNAADAVEDAPDRRITLSARVEGEVIALRVRDRGPGIADALTERIFDPFFTTKGMGAGLGLGLSITANIVRDLGGTIEVRNMHPGAEFCVRLPVARTRETLP